MNMNLSLIDCSGTIIDRLEVKPMRMLFMSTKTTKACENKKLNNSFLTSIKSKDSSNCMNIEKSKSIILLNKSVDKKDFTFRPKEEKTENIFKYDKKIIKNKILPIKIINNVRQTFMKVIRTNENEKDIKNDKTDLNSATSTIYDSIRKSKDSPKIMKKHPGFKNFFD
jgi:hypothetical protein